MELTQDLLQHVGAQYEETVQLLMELAQIPAPSNHEELRAQFCKNWLDSQGAEGVYIDEELNVIYPVGCTEDNPLMVFMAHSDVVFPDTAPLPLTMEEGKIRCPGVGDDTANVAILLMAAKYIAARKLTPRGCGVLLVVNSGEEGLGNLKGSRKIMADFGHRVREFITFDGYPEGIVNRAVGSRRYRVEADTEGGHSYSKFGNRNAIACLAALINDLYAVELPPTGKTTYNVGTISGGTSVNTIAQHGEMLYEFRSDQKESLDYMEGQFRAAIHRHRSRGVDLTATLVGDRPCSGPVDEAREQALMERAAGAAARHYGFTPSFRSGSTDCNVPLSMGVPAVCVGCAKGVGAHTREEYIETGSLKPGLALAFELILYHF